MRHKTCLVAHNYTLSSVNHMYALKITKEMLMNLCYKIYMKNFLEKITEYQGMCERQVRNHSDNTNIDKCDKNILKYAITVYRDLCVSVANAGTGGGGGGKKKKTENLYEVFLLPYFHRSLCGIRMFGVYIIV